MLCTPYAQEQLLCTGETRGVVSPLALLVNENDPWPQLKYYFYCYFAKYEEAAEYRL